MPDLTSLNNNNSMVFTRQLKQGLSRNEFNPGGVHKTLSQYDLPSFGLDPDAPIFIQHGYGPGGLPLNIYRGNSRYRVMNKMSIAEMTFPVAISDVTTL